MARFKFSELDKIQAEQEERERMAEVFREEISKAGGGEAGGEEE